MRLEYQRFKEKTAEEVRSTNPSIVQRKCRLKLRLREFFSDA
jgi:hypothetical protein